MFSGQGAQYVGMGKELYDNYEEVRTIFKKADEVLGYSITDIMFHDEEKLNNTVYTQVAMFTFYAGIIEVLKKHKIEAYYTCGLSLGEYGAMYYAGVFDFETGLKILAKRGQFMDDASKKVSGKMSAIIGMDPNDLIKYVHQVKGYVKIANFNTRGQLVISGESEAVLEVNKLALENGAKRAILLNTSGPFHTDLMSEAADNLREYVKDIDFKLPSKELLVNTTGDFIDGNVRDIMPAQITSSVMFFQMINKLLENNVNNFIEIGPKTTLCSLVKKIDRKVNTMNVEDIKSLENTIHKLEV
jgi:[acyl-carrier-protein] S-malonyltransferase